MGELTLAWITAARDDLAAMDLLISNPELTNVVSFHAQQAIEKSFKALIEHRGDMVPRKHDLLTLYDQVKDVVGAIDLDTLDTLNNLYTESRYPGDLGLLPGGKPPLEKATSFAQFAKAIMGLIERAITQN